MIRDEIIDKLIQPFEDRQEAIELWVLIKIARRIKQIGTLSTSDLMSLRQLYLTGSDIREMNKKLAELSGLQVRLIKALIKKVAQLNYLDMKPFFDYRHRSFIPFEKNSFIQRLLTAIGNRTANTYVNLSRTAAFMLRDRKNPQILIPTQLSDAYQSAVDEAMQAVLTGTTDVGTAMRKTMEQMVNSGIRTVDYTAESGRHTSRSLPAAVRQNLIEGTRDISQEMQNEVGKEFGADGKELSAHPYSAPDHEPFQGLQFTNEQFDRIQNSLDFYDLSGKHFNAVKRHIGQYNCRHVAWSIVIGYSPPNYTPEQLAKWRRENARGYTDSKGKHRTMYECTQEQRRMEREIRKAKMGVAEATARGDSEGAAKWKAKVTQKTKEYKEFSKACGLSPKPDRLQIPKI